MLDDPDRVRSPITNVASMSDTAVWFWLQSGIDAKIEKYGMESDYGFAALTDFASRRLLTKVYLKKKSGGRKTRR